MALSIDSRDVCGRLPRTYRFGLTAASALALAAFAPQALAQDAPGTDAAEVTDEDGGILVTGIRFSIANSVNTKRNADVDRRSRSRPKASASCPTSRSPTRSRACPA